MEKIKVKKVNKKISKRQLLKIDIKTQKLNPHPTVNHWEIDNDPFNRTPKPFYWIPKWIKKNYITYFYNRPLLRNIKVRYNDEVNTHFRINLCVSSVGVYLRYTLGGVYYCTSNLLEYKGDLLKLKFYKTRRYFDSQVIINTPYDMYNILDSLNNLIELVNLGRYLLTLVNLDYAYSRLYYCSPNGLSFNTILNYQNLIQELTQMYDENLKEQGKKELFKVFKDKKTNTGTFWYKEPSYRGEFVKNISLKTFEDALDYYWVRDFLLDSPTSDNKIRYITYYFNRVTFNTSIHITRDLSKVTYRYQGVILKRKNTKANVIKITLPYFDDERDLSLKHFAIYQLIEILKVKLMECEDSVKPEKDKYIKDINRVMKNLSYEI